MTTHHENSFLKGVLRHILSPFIHNNYSSVDIGIRHSVKAYNSIYKYFKVIFGHFCI